MERGRSPLASITPFWASQFGTTSPTHWRLAERAAAETATGFKNENTWGGPPIHTGRVGAKRNWLGKEPLRPEGSHTRRYHKRRGRRLARIGGLKIGRAS